MKLLKLLLIVLLLIGAGAFGALNAEAVTVDLFGFGLSLPLGALLLACMLLGALAGALAMLPFSLRRRRAERPEQGAL